MTSNEDEIEEIRSEESRRSKRPVDVQALRRRRILERKFMEALESGNEDAFIEALIHDLGQLPGTVEYESSMRVWRQYQKEKER